MRRRYELEGLSSASEEQFVVVRSQERTTCLPLTALMTDEKAAKQQLARNGIVLVGSAEWRKFMERVNYLDEFPTSPLIEHVGWNGSDFALPDGSVSSAEDENIPSIVPAVEGKCRVGGKFKRWRSDVAGALAGQHVASFVLMAVFMPPLPKLSERRGNVGFEIVGPPGTGKSTLLYIASSAMGGSGQDGGGHYWLTLDTTYNALEDAMRVHSDLLMIMDEANLLAADQTAKARAEIFKAFAFKVAGGTVKSRFGATHEAGYRLGFVISSNEPLASLVGRTSEGARAAADRLITVPVDKARPYGVFDHLPEGFESSSAFAQQLLRTAEHNHGHAIRKYLRGLLDAKLEEERLLRKQINRLVAKFRKKARVNLNNGSQVRVADAFGLVFAAGKLAQKFGVLPTSIKAGSAALACYQMHLADRAEIVTRPFAERLATLVEDDRIARLNADPKVRRSAIGVLNDSKRNRELLILPEHIQSIFPDWDQLRRSHEVQELLKRDGSHLTVKRKVGKRKAQRYYCFRVTSLP